MAQNRSSIAETGASNLISRSLGLSREGMPTWKVEIFLIKLFKFSCYSRYHKTS